MKLLGTLLLILLNMNIQAHSAQAATWVEGFDPETPSITGGWSSQFNELERSLQDNNDESYVFLISFAPEKTVSYANGTSLRDSLIALRGEENGSVGHTLVAWRCSDGTDVQYRGLSGMSGEISLQAPELRSKGFGLLGALAVFTDGHLQDAHSSALQYKYEMVQKGKFKMKWIGMKVSDSQCRKVRLFRNEFYQRGAHKNFGFTLEPSRFEGAGCSSYARQLLYEAGVMEQTAPNWTRELRVPYKLIANPTGESLPRNTEFRFDINTLSSEKIEDKHLLFRSWRFNQPGIDMTFADTELIYYTVLEAERQIKKYNRKSFPRSINTRYRKERQTGSGESKTVDIDKDLDSKTKAIYQSLMSNGLDNINFEVSKINGVTGLILDRPLN